MFEEYYGGVEDAKALLHAKRWDIYVNEKEKIVKGGYLVEVVVHDGKKVLREVTNNHAVEDPNDHDGIVLWGFDFNLSDEDKKGVGREGSSEFLYLLILIKLWPGNWKTQLKSINKKVDEENGKAFGKGNGRYRKVCLFSSN